MTESIRVSAHFGKPLPEHVKPSRPSRRFRILVLADFGSDNTWNSPVEVDRDDLDEVFQRMNVTVRLPEGGEAPALEIGIKQLEDFQPDQLFELVDWFSSLRTRRRRLQNDATFADEARSIMAADAAGGAASDAAGKPHADAPPPAEDDADLLSQALQQTEQNRGSAVEQIAHGTLDIDDYVRRVVAPFVVDKEDPRKAELIEAVDQAIAEMMRRLLHHPSFQRIEAAWMGVQMLVRRLETDSSLKISLVNISKEQLAEDVLADDDLSQSKLHQLLSAGAGADDPWTVVVGDYCFDASDEDTNLLGRLAQIHAAHGAALVAAGSPTITGCDDLATSPDAQDWTKPEGDRAASWQSLRELPAAANVALTVPRFLGRLPYGPRTQAARSVQFEEMPDSSQHEHYLWLNSAYAVATLLGNSFSLSGWSLGGGWTPELDGLPMHIYQDDGESALKPCGEVELTPSAAEALAAVGLTVVYSVRQQGAVQIPHLRSLASNQETLAGAWQ